MSPCTSVALTLLPILFVDSLHQVTRTVTLIRIGLDLPTINFEGDTNVERFKIVFRVRAILRGEQYDTQHLC